MTLLKMNFNTEFLPGDFPKFPDQLILRTQVDNWF